MKSKNVAAVTSLVLVLSSSAGHAKHWSAPTTPGLIAAGPIVREGERISLPSTSDLMSVGSLIVRKDGYRHRRPERQRP